MSLKPLMVFILLMAGRVPPGLRGVYPALAVKLESLAVR